MKLNTNDEMVYSFDQMAPADEVDALDVFPDDSLIDDDFFLNSNDDYPFDNTMDDTLEVIKTICVS